MIVAILAAASILGDRPLSMANPARQALVVHSLGEVVVRIDASGYVRARGCDGQLRHVGDIGGEALRLHINNEGMLTGFVWDPATTPEQRATFQKMMQAVGYSNWPDLQRACLPVPGAAAFRGEPVRDEKDLQSDGLRAAAP
jgi:hypothetical protein